MFSGRYEGPLSHVSSLGSYGFVARGAAQPAFGNRGRLLPRKRIFVHVNDVDGIYELSDGLFVSFQIVETMKSLRDTRLDATDVKLRCRLQGRISYVSADERFGFVNEPDLDLAPEYRDMFLGLVPDDAIPKENIFVGVGHLQGTNVRLQKGDLITFVPERVRTGRHYGKLEARDIRPAS